MFSLAGSWYNLPVTDPVRLNALASHAPGSYPEECAETLLTVSLSEPFARDGFCYKLVAAIIAP